MSPANVRCSRPANLPPPAAWAMMPPSNSLQTKHSHCPGGDPSRSAKTEIPAGIYPDGLSALTLPV
ncbi:lysis system o-spanin lipoprotein Rz1 [Photorhabdus australis]|uniref:lysis system o-spanin lipoprotein Rz1 n=1 Tax=Photorhabdus australis TaxID=286156 RepID=UPI001EED9B5C|nr:lysis system o-spanin lipoprotein Rz1 [Photorhabdus australis]